MIPIKIVLGKKEHSKAQSGTTPDFEIILNGYQYKTRAISLGLMFVREFM